MKAYVIYVITDYARPIAITLNAQKAAQYIKKCRNEDKYCHKYFIDTVVISNNIFEFDSI